MAAKEVKVKRNGDPYMALVLSDCTGLIDAKLWDDVSLLGDSFRKDDFVKVQGRVSSYRERHELVVERIRRAEQAEIELDDYLPRGERDVGGLWISLLQFVHSIEDERIRALLQEFVADEEIAGLLRLAPAAKSMHHAYLGGLLDHVVSLCGLADQVCHHYPWVNRDLVLAGVLLHDIGKIYELSYSRCFGYTDRGQLVGHIAIGLQMLNQKLPLVPDLGEERITLLQHLILSHHGDKERGSPVEPRFTEALIVHMLDDMDAKMAAARLSLQANASPSAWTARVQCLGQPILDVEKFLIPAA